MAKNLLRELISGDWRDPDTGEIVTLPVREILIEPGLTQNTGELLEKHRAEKFLLVCDETTYEIQGRAIEGSIKKKGWQVAVKIFPSDAEPTAENAERIKIKKHAANAEMIIASGSGTINDLCKYSSFFLKIPYVVFATAPSMNGYASANASIKIGRYKKSIPAHMPAAIYLDLDILAGAPARLIKSGVGDLLCRMTAQADWLVSHLVLGSEYKTAPFVLLEENERQLHELAPELLNGNLEAMRILAEGLILSGIGMYITGSSAPASQGEHLIAHYMEMLHPELPKTFHGEQIGVTTLTMQDIQETLLKTKISVGDYVVDEERILLKLGTEIGMQAVRQARAKAEKYENMQAREKMNDEWKSISGKILPLLAGKEKIYDTLKKIGAATTPGDLGWSRHYPHASANAFLLRDRFTFLDIVHVMRG